MAKTKPARHPTKFTDDILAIIDELLGDAETVLDPFAGVGKIHDLSNRHTTGVEIEPEWANQHPDTIVGDALSLPFIDNEFDAIATSPTYGNRMADHHNAKDGSKRVTYKHYLGHDLDENNSGRMQWGDQYREFHEAAWKEADRVCKGLMVLNLSDHVRKGKVMHVVRFHTGVLGNLGYFIKQMEWVDTPRMKFGANRDLRVSNEFVIAFRK